MDKGEVTMILIDTFDWLHEPKKLGWFYDQIDAAEIYCERKLKAHPDNLVGIVKFGSAVSGVALHPTKDLVRIRNTLASLVTHSHFPKLVIGIGFCRLGWSRYQHNLNKRVVVFAGGPLFHASSNVIPQVVNLLKESRAVIDVVNFGYRVKGSYKDDVYKRNENLKALVDAVNNDCNNENGESRYFFIPDDGFSLTHHISNSPILPPSLSPSLVAEEEEEGEEEEEARIIRRKAKIYPPPSLVAAKDEDEDKEVEVEEREDEVEEELPPCLWSDGFVEVECDWSY